MKRILKSIVEMKAGDSFTIEGVCFGSKGQMLLDGKNIRTKRKCKPIGTIKFTVPKEHKP